MNSAVEKQKVIRRTPNSDAEAKKAIAHREVRSDLSFASRSDKLAGDRIVYLRHRMDELAKAFPNEPYMFSVGKFYPYAVGGALYVEEPQIARDIERAEKKAKVMREAGYRFLILLQNKTEAEDLEALDTCGTRSKKQ